MADKIIVEYELVPTGGDKVISTVQNITEEWEKSEEAMKGAMSEKQIEATTEKLTKFNAEVEKTATGFTSAKAELQQLEKIITSGKLQGKDLQQAVAQAAKLKDRIQDARQEISRLASDTRLFDTFVEGGRAVAAAFSVAQGAAALFGEENKDLQKSILKVQGALALLTGAQELANIVTKQGGIATQAYGVALKVVEGIQKAFAVSAAASWAIATAGVSILIAGVVALAVAFRSAKDESEALTEQEEERQKLIEKTRGENEVRSLQAITDAQKEFDRQQDRRRKEGVLNLENTNKLELQLLSEKLIESEKQLRDFNLIKVFLNEEDAKAYRKSLEDRILDTKIALQKIRFLLEQKDNKAIDNLPTLKPDVLTIEPTEVKIEKVPEVKLPVKLQPEFTLTEEDKKRLTDAYFQFANSAASSIQQITQNIFSGETQALQEEKDKQLILAGENARKREAIEKQFAVKSAELRRKQAIAEKVFAVFNIGLQTAQSITKILSDPSIPYYIQPALIAIQAATAGLQLAAVLSQPLPEIPKFKKGVIGFKGKGTQTSDENLVMISNNESVMTGKATNKYKEELQAAQDLQLENLITHKYILPVLKHAGMLQKDGEQYDDFNLRRTIKQGQQLERENSKYIVSGILTGMREQSYFTKRYFA